jgi:hypothetical protein
VGEIAQMANTSKQRAAWLTHQSGFPRPVDELKMGTVWRYRDVERWLARRARLAAKKKP